MKIKFLGTSHGIAEKERFTSSILITVGEKYYVIDAGAPITKLLKESDVDFMKIGGIFITHSHADHYLGLVEFMCQLELFNEFSGVSVTVYAPENFPYYPMREFLFGKDSREVTDFSVKRGGSRREDGGEGNRLKCEFYPDGAFFDDGNVKITSIRTKHFYDSHAFLIEAEGKRVLITGDIRHDLIDFPTLAFNTPLDIVITEAAHPLLNAPLTVETFEKIKTDRMLITHICDFRNTPEMIAELTSKLSHLYPVTAVTDGTEVEV